MENSTVERKQKTCKSIGQKYELGTKVSLLPLSWPEPFRGGLHRAGGGAARSSTNKFRATRGDAAATAAATAAAAETTAAATDPEAGTTGTTAGKKRYKRGRVATKTDREHMGAAPTRYPAATPAAIDEGTGG